MEYSIKIAGCAFLALLCVTVPILTALSFVYHGLSYLSVCLALLSIAIALSIFMALMNAE